MPRFCYTAEEVEAMTAEVRQTTLENVRDGYRGLIARLFALLGETWTDHSFEGIVARIEDLENRHAQRVRHGREVVSTSEEIFMGKSTEEIEAEMEGAVGKLVIAANGGGSVNGVLVALSEHYAKLEHDINMRNGARRLDTVYVARDASFVMRVLGVEREVR